jgi:hypothetical protein
MRPGLWRGSLCVTRPSPTALSITFFIPLRAKQLPSSLVNLGSLTLFPTEFSRCVR